jgi:hypothetical protein
LKKNTIIALIISLLLVFTNNNIFAYNNSIQAKIQAIYDKNDNSYPLKFRNAVAAYKDSKTAFAAAKKVDGWANNDVTNTKFFSIGYNDASYASVAYSVHDNPIANYINLSQSEYQKYLDNSAEYFKIDNPSSSEVNIANIPFTYAVYNMQTVNEPVNSVSYDTAFTKVIGNNSGVTKINIPIDYNYTADGSYSNIKPYRSHISDAGVYYTDKGISSAAIRQIQSSFPGRKDLYFSAVTRTTNIGGTGQYDSDSAWDFSVKFFSRWKKSYNGGKTYYYDTASLGYDMSPGGVANGTPNGILSILNNYDNLINLPIEPKRKIIVNHCALGYDNNIEQSWISGSSNIKSNVFADSSFPNSVLEQRNYEEFNIYYANIDGADRWTQNNKVYTNDAYSEEYYVPTRFGINIEKSKKMRHSINGVEYNMVYAGANAVSVPKEESDIPIDLYESFNPNNPQIYEKDGIYRIKPFESTETIYVNIYYKLTRDQRKNVYVRHIDKDTGTLIPGTSNNRLKTTDNIEVYNENTAVTHSEKYTIDKNKSLVVETTKLSQYNGKIIEYKGMKYKGELTYKELPIEINPTNYQNTFPTYSTIIDDNNEVFVNIYYSLSNSSTNVTPIPDIQLVGKLLFRNSTSEYKNSTSSESVDYIPPTKTLTSHINDAYPYYVKGANYSRITTYYPSVKTSVDVTGTYSGTYYYEVKVCSGNPQVCTTEIRSRTISGSVEKKSYEYTVPYTYTYYKLNNFRMYMIDNAELFDNNDNKGGQLFNESLTSSSSNRFLTTSNSYANRFKNGFTNYREYKVYWRGNEVTSKPVQNIEVKGICIDESCSNLRQAAQDEVNSKVANNGYLAAKDNNYRVMFYNTNDYLTLEEQDRFNYNNDSATLTGANARSYVLNPMIKSSYVELHNIKECVLDSTENDNKESYISNLRDNYMMLNNNNNIIKTTSADFNDKTSTVPLDRTNGMRELKAKINYKLIESGGYAVENNKINDIRNLDFNENITANKYRILTSTSANRSRFKNYEGDEVNKVNVLSPIQLQDPEIITEPKVNHSDQVGDAILQKDVEFSFTPKTENYTNYGYFNVNTNEFVKGYYVIFDFDLVNVRVHSEPRGTGNSSLYNGNGVLSAHSPIYISNTNGSITAKTTSNWGLGSIKQLSNKIRTVAVSKNITRSLQDAIFFNINTPATLTNKNMQYVDKDNIKNSLSSEQRQRNLIGRLDIVADSFHAVYKDYSTLNIGRIYDFKITDCNDLDFKSVFRKTTTNNVNELNKDSQGNYYNFFSGTKHLVFDINTQEGYMINRDTEIGTIPKRILPLGPYKNPVNLNHITAPKLGYRISFDLKTTGLLENVDNRKIVIKPSYYYISKDGKTNLFSEGDNTLDVYYKNSSGRYIKFENSGYTIQFKPKDGYRNIPNILDAGENDTFLSTKLQVLKIASSSGFELKRNMLTTSNDEFLQGWYGEFKLPNSAILVKNGDINNPLKDGYIGVKFDISCITEDDRIEVTLNYNRNDTGSGTAKPNTSQWDYEGFMGYAKPGEALTTPLKLQLERGIWTIDSDTNYNKIKGTVVLFDLDNRASDDFQ